MLETLKKCFTQSLQASRLWQIEIKYSGLRNLAEETSRKPKLIEQTRKGWQILIRFTMRIQSKKHYQKALIFFSLCRKEVGIEVSTVAEKITIFLKAKYFVILQ